MNEYTKMWKSLFSKIAELKTINEETQRLQKLNEPIIPVDPFEYINPTLENYKVLIYFNGTYYEPSGKSKGALYEALKLTEPETKNWLRNIEPHNLPAYMKRYEVMVALATPIFTGDLITTLGHIISSVSYNIRLHKPRINNTITITHEGVGRTYNLGRLVYEAFIDPNASEKMEQHNLRILYSDNNWNNNRIENLQLGRLEGEEQ